MRKLILIIGEGPTRDDDVAMFRTKFGNHPHDFCGINRAAGKVHGVDFCYSYHPDLLEEMAVPDKMRVLSCNLDENLVDTAGSSARQAAQLALKDWGYHGVVLAGVPLTGHHESFRPYWEPHVRMRAMSGYLCKLLGAPSVVWCDWCLK